MTTNSLISWPITAVVSEKRPVNAPRTRPVMTSVEMRQVLTDHGLVAPGQAEGVHQLLEVVGHEGDVGRFECHIGARGAHGNADAGRGQGRGVVDAVADHQHRAVFLRQLDDPLDLLFGLQVRVDLVNASQKRGRGHPLSGTKETWVGSLVPHHRPIDWLTAAPASNLDRGMASDRVSS